MHQQLVSPSLHQRVSAHGLRLCILFIFLFTASAASAQNAPELTQDAAISLINDWLNACIIIPVGNFKLNLETTQLTQYLKQFEVKGFVTITPINQDTGNVFGDILRHGQDPFGTIVHVQLAPGVDHSQLCTLPNGAVGIPPGNVSVSEVVRFQPSNAPGPAGVPNRIYLVQANIRRNPSNYARQLNPALPPIGRFQTVFQYDYFKKQWLMNNPRTF
jgi:hypothetical protein